MVLHDRSRFAPRARTLCATSRWSPPRTGCRTGRTLWFTGLSGSGKSSVAMLVEQKLLEEGVARLRSRRRQPAARAQRGSGVHPGRPHREPAPAGAGRALFADSGRRCWCRRSVRWRSTATGPPGARRCGAGVLRGVLRHTARGVRAARPEGSVRQSPRRRDHATSPVSTAPTNGPSIRTCGLPQTTASTSWRSKSSTCSTHADERPPTGRPAGDPGR